MTYWMTVGMLAIGKMKPESRMIGKGEKEGGDQGLLLVAADGRNKETQGQKRKKIDEQGNEQERQTPPHGHTEPEDAHTGHERDLERFRSGQRGWSFQG